MSGVIWEAGMGVRSRLAHGSGATGPCIHHEQSHLQTTLQQLSGRGTTQLLTNVFHKEKLSNITLAFGGAALGLQASLTVLSKLDMMVVRG